MPHDVELDIGVHIQGSMPDGKVVESPIVGLNESEVTLDGNHPLAGKDLTFELELLDIV